jgi:microcompartment protein CcmL/EutN
LEIDMGEALGMIETRGLVAMIEADAARGVGEVIALHVIPRPHESLEGVLPIGKPQAHMAGK